MFILTVVFSRWELTKILNFLEDYLEAKKDEIGMARIEKYFDKNTQQVKDSNRAIILMKRDLYQRAIDAGLDLKQPQLDFRIAEHVAKPTADLSEESTQTGNLYLQFLNTNETNLSTNDIHVSLKEKLAEMENFGFLNTNDFKIFVPLKDRETGTHKNVAYINFVTDVDMNARHVIKTLLHDSKISGVPIKVWWAKKH